MNEHNANGRVFRHLLSFPAASAALVVLAVMLLTTPCPAAVSNGVTFAWSPNPPADNVSGYRLLFGPESRYASSGELKAGFAYTAAIDLSTSTLCTGPSFSRCQYLGSDKLECHDLFDNPRCTVAVPPGTNYFTLQAYNSVDESDYSRELKYPTASLPMKRSVVPLIAPLLLNSGG